MINLRVNPADAITDARYNALSDAAQVCRDAEIGRRSIMADRIMKYRQTEQLRLERGPYMVEIA